MSTRRISDLEYVCVQLQVWVQVWLQAQEQLTNAGQGHDHHEGEWQHLRLERHLPVVHALQQKVAHTGSTVWSMSQGEG